MRSSSISDHQKPETPPTSELRGHDFPHQDLNLLLPTNESYNGLPDAIFNSNEHQINDKETLALFPLQPSGILQAKSTSGLTWLASAETSNCTPSSSSSETGNGGGVVVDDPDHHGGGGERPFFDFFSAGSTDQVCWESRSSMLD